MPRFFYRCANCGRELEVAQYRAHVPTTLIDKSMAHNIIEPTMPAITLFCTCGHYTDCVAERAVGWAKAVRPCPRGFNDSRPISVGDSRSLRVGTLRFAHPALGAVGVG